MGAMMAAIRSRGMFILIAGALFAWGVCGVTDVRAEPHQGMMRGQAEHGKGMRDFAGHALRSILRQQKDLGLSPDQRAKIKAVASEYAKTRIRGEADFKLSEVDVRTLVRDEKTDISAIESAIKKSENAQAVLRLEGVKALRAAVAVLTPEQREKWRAGMMERRGPRHGGEGRAELQSAEEHDAGDQADADEFFLVEG